MHGVVPVTVKIVAGECDGGDLSVGDHAFGVGAGVQVGLDFESPFVGGGTDQADDKSWRQGIIYF